MRFGTRKDAQRKTADPRTDERSVAWSPRAGAWALTPSALIPFGSFVPPPRRGRQSDARGDRR
ncbi:MAG: hypothetical protein WEB52_14190 [Dehalococcoidia bacterium]